MLPELRLDANCFHTTAFLKRQADFLRVKCQGKYTTHSLLSFLCIPALGTFTKCPHLSSSQDFTTQIFGAISRTREVVWYYFYIQAKRKKNFSVFKLFYTSSSVLYNSGVFEDWVSIRGNESHSLVVKSIVHLCCVTAQFYFHRKRNRRVQEPV